MKMEKYEGNDNYGRPRRAYVNKLQKMSKAELSEETEQMIWLSAFAGNNPRSDYHWQCDACYDEWTDNRKNEVGYEKAYDKVCASL